MMMVMKMVSRKMVCWMLLGALVAIPGAVCRNLEFFFDPAGSISGSDDYSATSLWIGIETRNLPLVQSTIKCCPHTLDVPYSSSLEAQGGTSLHLSVVKRATPILIELLKAGADTEARDSNGNTALQVAAAMGNLPAVKALAEAGADIKARVSQQYTPLIYASFFSHPRVVEFLLAEGADPDALSFDQITALAAAAGKDSVIIAQILLKAGADANIIGFEGKTALHGAAYYGAVKLVRFLGENGADPTIRDDAGNLAGDVLCACLDELACFEGQCTPAIVKQIKKVWNEISTKEIGASSSPATQKEDPPSVAKPSKTEETVQAPVESPDEADKDSPPPLSPVEKLKRLLAEKEKESKKKKEKQRSRSGR